MRYHCSYCLVGITPSLPGKCSHCGKTLTRAISRQREVLEMLHRAEDDQFIGLIKEHLRIQPIKEKS